MATLSRKRILTVTASIAVAALLLWLCFRDLTWAEVRGYLADCRWEWVLLSMGLGAVVFWLRALRWRMMLLPVDPATSRTTCFNAINIGYFASNALSRIGEFVRCGYVVRHSSRNEDGSRRASFDKVLGSVVADRVWDALSLALLLGLMLALTWTRYGAAIGAVLFGEAGSALLTWGLLSGALVLLIFGGWLIYRLRERSRLFGRLWGFVAGMIDGVKACFRMKGAWKFFLLTAAIWGLYWAMISCIVAALSLSGIGPLDTLLMMLVGSIVAIIPVPGAFGTYHAALTFTLSSLFGLPTGLAAVFATLSHESQLLTQVLFGTGSLIHESFRSTDTETN